MIKSMTGFGKGESRSRFGRFTVELRTVNHRYFDLSSKIPNGLALLEDRTKELLHRFIKRGKVNLFVSHHSDERNYDLVSFDEKAVDKYGKMLSAIKKRLKIQDEIKLSHILSFSDVIIQEQKEIEIEAVWPSVKDALEKAIQDCNKMREREGRALYKDLVKRIKKISGCLGRISELAPEVVKDYKRKLDARIQDIVKNKAIDEARLEIEVALFAKQCDISEELARAKSHLDGLDKLLKRDDEAGRKLDFILQELNRETNTLGAKANDIKISKLVIEIKSELEKMREQVQNIE
jgi:uncharacterized protein (TIGR00255 family)